MSRDNRSNYVYIDRSTARRPIDYAELRSTRYARRSLRPASLIGPGLAIGVVLMAAAVLYAVYYLSGPVAP